MIREDLSRGVINSRIGKIKRLFKWAVSEQLAPPSLCHALATVQGLQRGRTKAREAEPVKPVEEAVIEATMAFLPADRRGHGAFPAAWSAVGRRKSAAFVRATWIEPRRSGSIGPPNTRPNTTDANESSLSVPRRRTSFVRTCLRPAEAYCFSPAESEARRKAELRANRKSKVQPSQVDRSKPGRKRTPGDRYTRYSYNWAIRRACLRAGIAPWAPNRLRHSAATEIRSRFGLEAAQVALGHANADVTQVYAERDAQLARDVMRQIG